MRHPLLLSLPLLLALLSGCQTSPESTFSPDCVIQGEVQYLERMALPPRSEVVVQLLGTYDTAQRSRTLAETRISGAVGSPVPFRMDCTDLELERAARMGMVARIVLDGRTLFESTDYIDPAPALRGERLSIRVQRRSDERR